MEMSKIYKIRKQENNIGAFSGFKLHCSFQQQDKIIKLIHLDIEPIEKEWEESTLKGITLFYNFYKDHFKGELKIRIEQIFWFPIDTRELLVTYTIIRVLCHRFQLDFMPILNQPMFASFSFLNKYDFRFENENYCI